MHAVDELTMYRYWVCVVLGAETCETLDLVRVQESPTLSVHWIAGLSLDNIYTYVVETAIV